LKWATSTIKINFQKLKLKNTIKHVTEEEELNWDSVSIATASRLLDKLNSTKLVYLLVILIKHIYLYWPCI